MSSTKGKRAEKDYSQYLVLYSGGADSTYFILKEKSAKHLIHYSGMNEDQTMAAVVNANILNRFLTVVPPAKDSGGRVRDGETNEIHALYDAAMAIDAGIRALSFGMRGIVMCFNADDLGINVEAVAAILKGAGPHFEVITPLRSLKAAKIRTALGKQDLLRYVSCMMSTDCGSCPKCRRGY